MARFDDELDTTGLRDYLLAKAVEFREILAHPVRPGHDGRPVLDEHGEPRRYPLNAELWELLTPSGALVDGGPYRFARQHLPDGHFALALGGLYDTLELGADNVLRLVID